MALGSRKDNAGFSGNGGLAPFFDGSQGKPDSKESMGYGLAGKLWPCIHGTDCDGSGLDCGPDQSRKKPAPKAAAELADIRARAWATRRANYGPSGHNGSYAR